MATRLPSPAPTDRPATDLRPGAASSRFLQANWSHILASLEDGVVVSDPAERIVLLNHAAEQLTGWSDAQMRGTSLRDMLASNGWILDLVRATLAAGQGRRRGEGMLVGARGRQVPVAVTASPILDTDVVVRGTLLLLHDLSYRKELEEDARYAERRASLELVAAGLAHEIKNPLGGIRGAAQLLERLGGSAIGEYTSLIVREVDRLTRLLDQLRELTQPIRLDLQPLNVHRILHDVLTLQRQTAEWGSIVLELQFDPSLPEILGDEARLTQVFLNLVRNAIQAMAGCGTLGVSTRMETDYHIRQEQGARGRFLSVDVEDTGPGIPTEHAERLFAPFFTTRPGGSGLGLAICQQLVAQHGGRIQMRNRRRGGTLARVTLPVAPAVR